MRAYSCLLEGEPLCHRQTSELRKGEPLVPPNLRGRKGEPLEGGMAAGGWGRLASLGLRMTLGGERGYARCDARWKERCAAFV